MEDYFKGRGAQSNPHNRFAHSRYSDEHPEGLDEPMITLPQRQVFYEKVKNIISKSSSPDLGNMRSVNPYQGCEHGCIYCYARNSHEYWGFSAGIDFETRLVAKPDAPRLLEETFQRASWQPAPIALSGNTDCYQPLEKKLQLTRRLLEVCLKYGNPVSIITKNVLIERDLSLLQELAADRLVHVWFSINTLSETLRSRMEPRTARISRRLAAMEKLSRAGIPCGAMIAPVIPGLNHHEIARLLQQVAAAGALSAAYTTVRLNGVVGPLFEEWLHKNFPDRADRVLKLVKSLHGGELHDTRQGRRLWGEGPLADSIQQLFRIARNKYLQGKEMPAYDLNRFRRNGSYRLF